jgi:small-conductance mechanosensitive channel
LTGATAESCAESNFRISSRRQNAPMTRPQIYLSLLLVLFTPSSAPAQLQADLPQPSTQTPAGAPVILNDEPVFLIYGRVGSFTPQERAKAIGERLDRLSKTLDVPLDAIEVTDIDNSTVLTAGEMVIMAVTEGDATPLHHTRHEVAQDYAKKIQAAVAKSREQVTLRALMIDSSLALLYTVFVVAILILLHKVVPKIYGKIDAWREAGRCALKIQRVELLSADQIAAGLTGTVRAIRIVLLVTLLYVYLTSVLSLFPWTRGISAALFAIVLSTLRAIGQAFTTYIPDVISIVVIILVTRYIIKLISLLFSGIRRGAITFSGFHRDWAEPTYKIVRFLVIVFAAIACFPYIPGSKSEGFRGISVFLGLLISLGSAAAISNIVAGLVLTYMRPFREGDRVKIADTVGDITEKTLLVTRIRTIKNVDITIPNSMVLSSHIINFSSSATRHGLILHTSVTIGYDVPWKKIHDLLIAAARATPNILANPEPFVLQTSLGDFYVTYELNAFTAQPNVMAVTYSVLHENIQDMFNQAGVEIMSPHYTQIRDGNKTTIPDQYLPKHYQAPHFRIWPIGAPQEYPTSPSKGL